MWRARFFKTRGIATTFVTKRGVRLSRAGETRKVSKPGTRLALGDIVSVPLRSQIVTVRVVDFGTRRGPAEEARLLYEQVTTDEQGDTNA